MSLEAPLRPPGRRTAGGRGQERQADGAGVPRGGCARQRRPAAWLGIVAFGKLAELLLRHAKGDLVSASGRVQVRRWADHHGTGRGQLRLVADALVSVRTVRPGGGRKRAEDQAPFDDGLEG